MASNMTRESDKQRAGDQGFLVAALYHFTPLPRFESLREPIQAICERNGIRGTLLLADEGINGTIAGRDAPLAATLEYLRSIPELGNLEHKESRAASLPFHRMKVRLKKEIVTMGVDGIDPLQSVGTYVEPADWNDLISDPDTIVVDTRNTYETAIGTFRGAIDPQTSSFREFPDWVRSNAFLGDKPKIAMFCTGGIRCEKATALVKAEGFDDVFHLKGGILKYLETVPETESRWEGECFVFDNRVSVGHGLKPGPYDLCHACRHPISETDKASPEYEHGVSCPHCHDRLTEEKRARFRSRQKQVELARARGEKHIAADHQAAKAGKNKRRAISGIARN
jgi:UPF0176 protein